MGRRDLFSETRPAKGRRPERGREGAGGSKRRGRARGGGRRALTRHVFDAAPSCRAPRSERPGGAGHRNPPENTGMARTMRTARTMALSNLEICFHGNSNFCTCTPRVALGPGPKAGRLPIFLRHPRTSASQLISDPFMATGCSPAPKPPFPWRLAVRRAQGRCATLGIISPSFALHTSRSTSP